MFRKCLNFLLLAMGLNRQANLSKRKPAYYFGLHSNSVCRYRIERVTGRMVLLSARRQQPRPLHSHNVVRKAVLFLGCLLSGRLVLVNGFFVRAPAVGPSFPTCHHGRCSFAGIGQMRCSASAPVAAAEALEIDEADDLDFTVEVLTVGSGEGGKRLDAFLATRMPEQSRSYFGGLCQLGMVLVGGKNSKKSVQVEEGQEVEVRFVVSPELSLEGENIPLDILFEDDDIIAISKPAGMVVHPAPGSWNGTFVNALVYHLAQQNREFSPPVDLKDGEHYPSLRPGVVHRLDKGTTGVLLAAKNPTMQAKLATLFAEREIKKSYLAVCVGNPGEAAVIDVPIGRHPRHRQRMVAVPTIQPNIQSRRALSVVSTAAFDGKLSVVEVGIETGRTHQIRVHMQHRRTPVLGDEVYGNKDWNRRLQQSTGMTRPLLHAQSLEFEHPKTGDLISLVAPLPDDIAAVVRRIYPQVDDEHPEWLEGGAVPGKEKEEENDEDKSSPGYVPKDLRDYSLH